MKFIYKRLTNRKEINDRLAWATCLSCESANHLRNLKVRIVEMPVYDFRHGRRGHPRWKNARSECRSSSIEEKRLPVNMRLEDIRIPQKFTQKRGDMLRLHSMIPPRLDCIKVLLRELPLFAISWITVREESYMSCPHANA